MAKMEETAVPLQHSVR